MRFPLGLGLFDSVGSCRAWGSLEGSFSFRDLVFFSVPSKGTVTSEAEEHSKPLNGVIARFRVHINTRSPFQNASADILVEFFLQAIPTKEDARFRSQFTRECWAKRAPVNVSAVCRHWREVALSSPILWSTIRRWYRVRGIISL